MNSEKDKKIFSTGAARSEEKPRYDLIPYEALRRIAQRYALGAAKFGDNNWKKGGEDFIRDIPNHIIEHLSLWLGGDRSDDHLAAAAWGCCAMLYFDEQSPKRSSLKDWVPTGEPIYCIVEPKK